MSINSNLVEISRRLANPVKLRLPNKNSSELFSNEEGKKDRHLKLL
jgi:hypothetical protein